MKKILFSLMIATSFVCSVVSDNIKRCENDEAICYIYDSGWAGFAKSGRGAAISCKFKQ